MYRWSSLALLTLSLAACSQQPKSPAGLPPASVGNYDDVDGSWAMTPKLGTQALTPDGVNTLYYERALVAASAWGPIEVDRSNGERGIGDGKTLTLNGTQHSKGYGVHAPSELKYSLAGTDNAKCVRFKAQVGIDDEVGNRGSAVFQVWGDGEKLYDSGRMTGASATKQVSVNLRGKSTFRMVVTDAGDGKSFDHADWINPTITCVPDMRLNVPQATGVYQDTHGNVPVTFTNNSKTFSGELTYGFVDDVSTNDPGTRFLMESKGTRINGDGTVTRNVSVFMRAGASPALVDANGPYPDALVVYYAGEEVARVALRVYTLAQMVRIDFPDEPFNLRVGESRTVQARIRISPGGETTGPTLSFMHNPYQNYDSANNESPVWWDVSGQGSVPKEGGLIPLRITAVRAPKAGEETEPTVQVRRFDQTFGQFGGAVYTYLKLRFLP